MATPNMQTNTRGDTSKFIAAGCSLVAVFFGEIVGYLIAALLHLDIDLLTTAGGAVAGIGMMLILGGKSHFTFDLAKIGEAFKFMWWIVLISLVLMVWDFYDYAASGSAIDPGWFLACLSSFVLCLAIGFSEECEFRGLITGGALAQFGGTRRGVLIATAIGALFFGAAHISWGELDYGDVYSLIQAALKIIQTGMYAVMLTAVMLKTKSILGVALVHAFDDYALFVSAGIFGDSLEVDYVTTASVDEALTTIYFYLIICALYLPTFIKAIRYLVKEATVPDFGPFVDPEKLAEKRARALGMGAAPLGMEYPAGPVAPYSSAYGQPQGQQAQPMGYEGQQWYAPVGGMESAAQGYAGPQPPYARDAQYPAQSTYAPYQQTPYAQMPYAQEQTSYPQAPYAGASYMQQGPQTQYVQQGPAAPQTQYVQQSSQAPQAPYAQQSGPYAQTSYMHAPYQQQGAVNPQAPYAPQQAPYAQAQGAPYPQHMSYAPSTPSAPSAYPQQVTAQPVPSEAEGGQAAMPHQGATVLVTPQAPYAQQQAAQDAPLQGGISFSPAQAYAMTPSHAQETSAAPDDGRGTAITASFRPVERQAQPDDCRTIVDDRFAQGEHSDSEGQGE